MQKLQDFLENNKRILFAVSSCALVCLVALCICLPAQSQLLKIPFLGIACLGGLCAIIQQKGKNISRHIKIWFSAYLLYNMIWSVIGFANQQVATSDFFRVGVIWSAVFFFVVSGITERNLRWICYAIIGCLCVEAVSVLLLMGYGFQLWPNLIKVFYPTAAIGIHVGYTQVSAHFVGGMAFTAPVAYAWFVMHGQRSWRKNLLAGIGWFAAVFAIMATSRRIIIVALPVVCTAVVVAAFFTEAKKRRKYVLRALVCAGLTGAFMFASAGMISKLATGFLQRNEEAIMAVYQNRYENDGTIRYTENIVFNPFGVAGDGYPTDPDYTKPTDPDIGDDLTDPETEQLGFFARLVRMLAHLEEGTPRGEQILSVLNNSGDNLWFGVGFGAELPGYPWNDGTAIYEMEFVVRIYTTGLIGLAWLLLQLGYIGVSGLWQMKRKKNTVRYLTPILAAYLAALIATLSNPYIFSGFDYLLMLFLPVAALNCAHLAKPDEAEQQSALAESLEE